MPVLPHKTADFECVKASAMGEYLPVRLGMEEGEKPVFMRVVSKDAEGENYVLYL
jgi:hypothetical protein